MPPITLVSIVIVILVVAAFTPAHVNAAASTATVLIQDSTYPGRMGLFSTNFVGVSLDVNNRAVVNFVAGDQAPGEYVLSRDIRTQTDVFFENTIEMKFLSTGTWWFYLAAAGSTLNFDYIQVRIVPNSWTGEITPKFQNPPFTWRSGYPPYGVPFTSDDATGSDGSVATLPSPTVTVIPSPRSSSSTSISVWLAPLLVGIIMIAMTVPIVIVAYKKGKQHAKNQQVQVQQEEEIENQTQQQQIDQPHRVEV